VYQQQEQQQQEQQEQEQDAENPFLDPPFSRIKTAIVESPPGAPVQTFPTTPQFSPYRAVGMSGSRVQVPLAMLPVLECLDSKLVQ
jgi:hypothetical protein